jgi:hypothetical protein
MVKLPHRMMQLSHRMMMPTYAGALQRIPAPYPICIVPPGRGSSARLQGAIFLLD